MIKAEIEGIPELQGKLARMAEAAGPRKTTYILLDAARIIARAIKRIAPKGPTGNLRRGVAARSLPIHPWHPAAAKATMLYRIAPHAHLVEFGTKARFDRKHGNRYTGVMPATPFFRVGWASTEGQVSGYVKDRLEKAVDEAAR